MRADNLGHHVELCSAGLLLCRHTCTWSLSIAIAIIIHGFAHVMILDFIKFLTAI